MIREVREVDSCFSFVLLTRIPNRRVLQSGWWDKLELLKTASSRTRTGLVVAHAALKVPIDVRTEAYLKPGTR